MKKTGITVFLLQIQTPISILKRWLRFGSKRQPFIIGTTAMSVDEMFQALIKLGYQWDYLAYTDDGEVISMRWLYDNRQVHVRVYEDGQIGMHDEPNYEFNPVRHLEEQPSRSSDQAILAVLTALNAGPVSPDGRR